MREVTASPPSALESYRRDIAGAGTLSADEERALARRFHAGDKKAGERLVRTNLPFVLTIAREYRRWGVPLEDLVQQGNLGLLKAVARFDPERQCRLVTYAAYWVRAEIREYVVRGYRMVRLGTTKGERRALRAYRKTGEGDPVRLAELSGLKPESAERLLPMLSARDVSLDEVHSSGGAAMDRLASGAKSPEEFACESSRDARTRRLVANVLRGLGPRDRVILRARLLREEPLTLESLGQRFGISKERVRQLEERIKGQVRSRLETLPELLEAG